MDISKIGSSYSNNLTTNAVQSSEKASDSNFEERLNAAMENKDDKELKNVCKQFEGIMLNMLFKQMRATVIQSDLIEKDPGTEIFQSMLDEKLMEEASSNISSFGLADSLYKQLSKQLGTSGNKNESKAIEETKTVDK